MRMQPKAWTHFRLIDLADAMILAVANLAVWIIHPWLSLSFAWRRRRLPAFATPRGVSELVQWRKIFDRNPLFPILVDKLRVKDWARSKANGVETAPIVWSGTTAADIPEALLVPGYVIKTNHGTGTNYFPHRGPRPRDELNRQFDAWLARRFDHELQWAYGQVPPRIIVEQLIGGGAPIWEMTFRCSDGKAATAFVAIDQKTGRERQAYFTGAGERLPDALGRPPDRSLPPDFRLGPDFARARELAELLSRGLDFVRVDLMVDGEHVYLCEMTIYPGSGFSDEIRTNTADRIERGWIEAIGKSWFLSTPQPWPLSLYAGAFRRWAEARGQVLQAGGATATRAGLRAKR